MKDFTKRLLALLLVFALTFGEVAPAMAVFAEVPVPTDTELLGTLATATGDLSGTGWAWEQSSKTLTLNNFNMDLSGEATPPETLIVLPEAATVVLAGDENSIIGPGGADCCAISGSSVSFAGDAYLCISGFSCGISAVNDVSFDTKHLEIECPDSYTDPATVSYPVRVFSAKGMGDASAGDIFKTANGTMVPNAAITAAETTGGYNWYFVTDGSDSTAYAKSVTVAKPALSIVDQDTGSDMPARRPGASATIEVTAAMTDYSADIFYQWYSCKEDGSDLEPIDGATGSSYTFSGSQEAGDYYFCCVATAILYDHVSCSEYPLSATSDPIVIEVDESSIYIEADTGDIDLLDVEGWAWDADTYTLTLDGIDFTRNVGDALYFDLPDTVEELTILLAEGSVNKISSTYTGLVSRNVKNFTIKGDGKLTVTGVTRGANIHSVPGTMLVADGADVTIISTGANTPFVLNEGTLEVEYGSSLRVDGTACSDEISVYIKNLDSKIVIDTPEGGKLEAYDLAYTVVDDEGNYAKEVLFLGKPDFDFVDLETWYEIDPNDADKTVTITANAEFKGSSSGVTYQWYTYQWDDDSSEGITQLIPGATGSSYTVDCGDMLLEDMRYFACEASYEVQPGDVLSITTEVICVAAFNAPIDIYSDTPDTDKLATEGWAWDADTFTLTLDGVNRVGADRDSIHVSLPTTVEEFTILLAEGSENIFSGWEVVLYVSGPQNTVIKGNGTLTLDGYYGIVTGNMPGELRITDGADVTVIGRRTAIYLQQTNIVVDPSSSLVADSSEISGRVAIDIGGYLDDGTRIVLPEGGRMVPYASGRTVEDSEGNRAAKVKLVGSVYFEKYPENVQVAPGKSVTLAAKTEPLPEGYTVKYAWYDDNTGAKVSSSASYTFTPKSGTVSYLYCNATVSNGTDTYVIEGDIVVVFCGRVPLNSPIYINADTPTTDYLARYGYKWDAETYTLTLNNLNLDTTYSEGIKFSLPSTVEEVTIELVKGSVNNVTSTHDGLYASSVKNFTIKGDGTLNITGGSAGVAIQAVPGTMLIAGGADVTINCNGRFTAFDLNSSTLQVEYGSSLTVDGTASSGARSVYIYRFSDNTYVAEPADAKLVKYNACYTVTEADGTTYAKKVKFLGNPEVRFENYPEDVHVDTSKSVTLTAKATAGVGLAVKYAWYNSEGVKVGSSASYTFTPKQGCYSLYCVASVTTGGKTYEKEGELVTVSCITRPCTSNIDISPSTPSFDNLSTYGYKWDAETGTLTLNNFCGAGCAIAANGFSQSNPVIIEVLGKNTIEAPGSYNAIYADYVVFTGGGSLKAISGRARALYSTRIRVQGGTKLDLMSAATNYSAVRASYIDVIGKGSEIHAKGERYRAFQDMVYSISDTTRVGYPADGRYDEAKESFTDAAGNHLLEVTLVTVPLHISSQPDVVTNNVGSKATLKLDVVNTTGKSVSYAWYKTDSYGADYAEAGVKVGSGSTLTLTGKTRSIDYYYCVVSAGSYKYTSDVIAVVTGAKGAKVVTERLYFIGSDASTSVDKLATDGWKWDADTSTLTLDGVDILCPFRANGSDYLAFTGNIELHGDNYGGLGDDYLTVYHKDLEINFTGSGSFDYNRINLYDCSTINVTGATLKGEGFTTSAEVTLDGANVTLGDRSSYFNNGLVLRNGATLSTTQFLRVSNAPLVIGEGCKLLSIDEVYVYDSATVDAGGLLACKYLYLYDTGSVLTVNGSLHITDAPGKQPVSVYSAEVPAIVLGSNAAILQPDVVAYNCDSEGYSYFLNDVTGSRHYGELTITDGTLQVAPVTSIGSITGTAKYGNVVKAGAVAPAGATVSYTWQVADTKQGPWTDFNTSVEPELAVSTRLAGKYLRVVAKGYGEYTGEAVSAPVGPVVGDPNTLMALYLDGELVGSYPFEADRETFNISTDSWPSEHTFTAVPVNEKAKVSFTLENSLYPDGITYSGRTAKMDFAVGSNTVTVTVVNGTNVREYVLNIGSFERTGNLYLDQDPNCGMTLTASWVDSEGNAQSVTVEESESEKTVPNIPYGTEVTITSTYPEGYVPYIYANIGEYGDYTKDGCPFTFVFSSRYSNKTIMLWESLLTPLAPEITFDWLAYVTNAVATFSTLEDIDNPGDYLNIAYLLLDEKGDAVAEGILEDGNNSITFFDLDPTKRYELIARYEVYGNDRIIELSTGSRILEPRTDVVILPASDHVVMKPGETYLLDVDYNGYLYGNWHVQSVSDTDVLDESQTYAATVDDKRVLQITSLAEGTAHITLRGDNADYTVVRVDVIAADTAPSVRLGVTSGTINAYDDSAITVPIYQMNCGHKITSAAFADPAVDALFAIEVVNDRTLKVVPKVPDDAEDMNWAAWAKSLVGTRKSAITIRYSDASSVTSSELLTIVTTAKAPSVKISVPKFNSFFIGNTQDIKFTISGKTVGRAKVDLTKATAKTPAIPAWLSISEDGKQLTLDNSLLTNNKGSGKIWLKVWPEGWRAPATVSASVSAAYTTPKLKLSPATVTVPMTTENASSIPVYLQSGDKKVPFESLNITDVRVAGSGDLALLTAKERSTYAASPAYEADYDTISGEISIQRSGDIAPAGKVLLIATLDGNPAQTVKLTLTVKNQAVPTIKLSKTSVSLYTTMGVGADEKEVKLSSSATGFNFQGLTYTVSDSKGILDLSSHLDVYTDYDGDTISVKTTADTVPGTTYKVKFTVPGTKAPVTLSVKANGAAPTLKLSKTSITINRHTYQSNSEAEITLGYTAKDYTSYIYSSDIKFETYLSNGVTPAPDDLLYIYANSGKLHVMHNDAPAGTYKVKVRVTLPDGVTLTAPVTLTVKITNTIPTVKASKTSATLFSLAQFSDTDSITYRLNGIDGYMVSSRTIELRNSKGVVIPDIDDYFNVIHEGDYNFTVTAADDIAPGTYKIYTSYHLSNGGTTKPAIVTVKVVDKVTGSATVKGNIDVTRPYVSMANFTLKFNGWNPADYDNGTNTMKLPILTWKVYAKNGKTALTTEMGALDNEGLVAYGEGNWLQDGSWFTNCSEEPYDVDLMLNTLSDAMFGHDISPKYSYTVKFSLRFPSISGKNVTFKDAKLTLKQGATKFYQSTTSIKMPILDDNAARYIVIRCKDKDAYDVAGIQRIDLVNSSVAKYLEVNHLYGDIYTISWKDDTPPLKKVNGTVKLQVFLDGNGTTTPNATLSVKVNMV